MRVLQHFGAGRFSEIPSRIRRINHPGMVKNILQTEGFDQIRALIKGSLDEKLPIYEQDPKSKRLDSFEKRFVRD